MFRGVILRENSDLQKQFTVNFLLKDKITHMISENHKHAKMSLKMITKEKTGLELQDNIFRSM